MKYTVQFSGTRAECEQQARLATRDYLGGARRYNKLVRTLARELRGRNSRRVYRYIRFCAAMVGVSGYWPQRAMVRDVLKEAVK